MSIDYKKIIKNQETRLKILNFLSFIPDEYMIKLQYFLKTGRKLNLKNPQRYTEKLQWYKLYYKSLEMVECVDKYDVRKYIEKKGLSYILNPCYGIYDSVDDIKWDELPNKFVMKDTLGGGGGSVKIIKNKDKEDIEELKKLAKNWTKIDSKIKTGGREWPYYSGKKHRIIIENYIESNLETGGLIDYKFFCFNGKVEYVYGIADRTLGKRAGLGIYDKDFKLLPYKRVDENKLNRIIEKPLNYEKMIEYSEKLSEDFPHARIDLYNQKGKIYFGEITFFDGSGYMCFNPDEFDYELGEKFNLRKLL